MLQLPETPRIKSLASVEVAYESCRQVTADFAKSFYLSTLLMPVEKRQAIWAIYVWCRRTDELVDSEAASKLDSITLGQHLDAWEERLERLFAGKPEDDFDVALVETIDRYPDLDIQPFRDMIEGQRMDLYRNRYETFEELDLYCYRVAGTVGLMSTVIMGINESAWDKSPWNAGRAPYLPIKEAVALGVANQLTNILRDVGEDARRGRIYLPLEDLRRFNYTEAELFQGVNDERWKRLMRFQIRRARQYFVEAEQGITFLNDDARWPVWAASMTYSWILRAIERNQYDVFNRRAYVSTKRKLSALPVALMRAKVL
ncbi:phytoene synthase [filamentous cyanobacterium LEGE 11480]|uniref:15-cis-phytoene synthase n=1 Tax=Romeriopsis navalis LEGE 11480 TaxID=2777977 RepID=A0A928VRN4_9CYAN|nr:phytoene synthase [Romeriopsis navalis]MBE9030914.1 phytoene synthase [Romeriopsis navalis LEGE 11480]